jgi:hypothetical protein
MEKLFFSILVYLTFSPFLTLGAQEYAVFKSNGESKNILKNKEKAIINGSIISEGIISVVVNDTILLLDNNGVFYQLDTVNKFSLTEIIKYEKQQISEGFTQKYFSYVWSQIRNKNQTSNNIGNIYREDLINELISPMDNVSIFNNEIEFTWKNNTKHEYSYFFLKNTSKNTMFIIKTKGNSLSLFTDNTLLVKGNSYSWAIAYKKYPTFNRVKFNEFHFLTEDDFNKSLQKYASVKENLKTLGYSNSEIELLICKYFNLCKN